MDYKNIIIKQESAIQIIEINRPTQLNALNKETIKELHKALNIANQSKEIRVVIITGTGTKAFVAGADIKEFFNFSVQQGEKLAITGQNTLFDFIENMEKPCIAAINGFSLGGGLELAMCCHIRLASENAKMGLPETSLGLIPGYGGTQRLAQLVGKGKANEMIFTAQMISANEALRLQLVNYVVPQDKLIMKTKEIANKIIKNSPQAITSAIRCINAGFDINQNGFLTEIKEFGKCFGTFDFKEGTTAFIEKRKPNF